MPSVECLRYIQQEKNAQICSPESAKCIGCSFWACVLGTVGGGNGKGQIPENGVYFNNSAKNFTLIVQTHIKKIGMKHKGKNVFTKMSSLYSTEEEKILVCSPGSLDSDNCNSSCA